MNQGEMQCEGPIIQEEAQQELPLNEESAEQREEILETPDEKLVAPLAEELILEESQEIPIAAEGENIIVAELIEHVEE